MAGVALGPGFGTSRFVKRLYTYAGRLVHYPRQTARFWVNLVRGQLITRKPLNVRMGKGKGARAGILAKISAGTPLLRVSVLRAGARAKLQRYLQARCAFRVGITPGSIHTTVRGHPLRWVVRRRIQRAFIYPRWRGLRLAVRPLRRPRLIIYLVRLYRWRLIVPGCGRLIRRTRASKSFGLVRRRKWLHLVWRLRRRLRRRQALAHAGTQGSRFARYLCARRS